MPKSTRQSAKRGTPSNGNAGGADGADLAPIVGRNLRELRSERGLSLEKLAQLSNVSRAMLGQIELGQSAPTINVLWKIASSLDVTFSTLIRSRESGGTVVLRAQTAKVLASKDGRFKSRALFPFDGPRRTEFYELTLAPNAREDAEAHAPGTIENLIVSKGAVSIQTTAAAYDLGEGDAIVFEADSPHAYVNTSSKDAVMYLVMTYAAST